MKLVHDTACTTSLAVECGNALTARFMPEEKDKIISDDDLAEFLAKHRISLKYSIPKDVEDYYDHIFTKFDMNYTGTITFEDGIRRRFFNGKLHSTNMSEYAKVYPDHRTPQFYRNGQIDPMHLSYSSSDEEEEDEDIQIITITFRVKKALFHEGSGCGNARCAQCGDKPKRYYRLVLQNGGNAFMCRSCFSGTRTDDDSCDSWNSDNL
jgi:hypothetical protein